MSKLYTITDIVTGNIVYENEPIDIVKCSFNYTPRQLAYCYQNNILIKKRYKIKIVQAGAKDYYDTETRSLMKEWDKTMELFRRYFNKCKELRLTN